MMLILVMFVFFFFKQKTAYEMRISDWSSDVCSSDLHGNDDHWAWAAAVSVSAALRRELEGRPRARLLVSGGSTPAPVFQALAKAPLDWARVDIALVDERWLLPGDPDSNAHLVREHLLRDHAAAARFESLTREGRRIAAAVADANLLARNPDRKS